MAAVPSVVGRKSHLGRVPIVPWVRCAREKCHQILAQRADPWQGDPIWIQCRRCGAMNRVDPLGSRIVYQPGDD